MLAYLEAVGYKSTVAALRIAVAKPQLTTVKNALICTNGMSVNIQTKPPDPHTTNTETNQIILLIMISFEKKIIIIN